MRRIPRQTATIPALLILLLGISIVPAAAEILGTNWFPIGPAPAQGFFAGGVTGRASAIAVNPFNLDDVYVGTAAGGVWHSTDGGQNWKPLSDQEASLAIGAIALQGCAAAGCARVYAGTGENAIRRDTYHGNGLLIGQETGGEFSVFAWVRRDGNPFDFELASINDVILDPNTSGASTRIYVTLSSGVTASATESTVTAPEPSAGGYGIYRSDDDGVTWVMETVDGTVAGDRPTDLEMNPADSDILYAGFLGKGVFKRLNSGQWCPLNDGIPKPPGCPNSMGLPDVTMTAFDHVEIALHPGDPSTLYATFGHCPDRLIQNCRPSVYKSTNAGMKWTQMLAGNSVDAGLECPRGYSRYTHALAVHPVDPNTLFLGGGKICKSINGGSTWAAADLNVAPGSSSWGPIVHLDHHEILMHPLDSNRMYETSDGGFAVSMDGGASWTPANDDLQITGFQSIASSPLTGRVIGATQDNSGMLWTGSRVWGNLPCCGDGGFTIMDLDDVMRMYSTTTFGGAVRSTDGGSTWSSISSGIPGGDPRSFYPPFVQDPSSPHPLYYGTNALYRSTNDGGAWSVVSPVLSNSSQPEIWGGLDVLTAIAVAPSLSGRLYIGYYGGEIFRTNAACASVSCWTDVSAGLPAAPVTWIAVHPADPNTAWASFSGFSGGAHVWKTTNGGQTWSPSATDLPAGVPVNTISVETGPPVTLWAGTDTGIYRSEDAGASWSRFSSGLPNVPVYQISLDETHGRAYAGTHGRGAFVLGRPFLSNFEGWVGSQIWDIPVYGNNFLPSPSCTMQLVRQDGTICATDTVDARGGAILTNASGELVTSNGGFWNGKPVAWACFNGDCIQGMDITQCNSPANPLTTVLVTCGGELGIDHILGCPQIDNPPSSLMGLSGLDAAPATRLSGAAGLVAGVAFDLTASIQGATGGTRSLCTVNVPFAPGESVEDVLERARDAINASETCAMSLVTAELEGTDVGTEEDEFPRAPRLVLRAPGLIGNQLVTALHLAPGASAGACFKLSGLGVPVLNQIHVMGLTLETAAGGAEGGTLTLVESSGNGVCEVTVTTNAGDDAAQIAQDLESAFQAPGIPGPNPGCPSEKNPRDVRRAGDMVITVFPSELEVCAADPAVGFNLRSKELVNVHPIADAGGDQTFECTGPGGATVHLDGSGSTDPDSTPGTSDDIVTYEWFEDFGQPTETLLGSGVTLTVALSTGEHEITLLVTDAGGLGATDTILVSIVDTTPPSIGVTVMPGLLWPPNHKMRDVMAAVHATDLCSAPTVVLSSVTSDEPDDARGGGDGHTVGDIRNATIGTADFKFSVRAERQGSGDGRVYTVIYTATDGAGNTAQGTAEVVVPKSQGK